MTASQRLVQPTTNRFVVFAALIAALGGLLFGYDTGIIASALPQIAAAYNLGTGAQQLVASSILIGCILGALGAGPLSDRMGRRKVVALVAISFMIGAIGAALSSGAVMLVLFRLFLGIAVGGASQIVPIYIAELAPAKIRGSLVVAFQLAIILGILLSSVAGYLIADADSWRITFALGAIPALLLLLGLLVLPESPRWLYLRGHTEQARKVLRRVRDNDAAVDAELEDIRRVEEQRVDGSWKELRSARIRPALVAGLGVALLCQITGINAVIYYAPTILKEAGFDSSGSLLTSMSVNLVLFVFTVIGLVLVDRWGRRRLLLAWVPLSVIALLVLGWSFSGTGGPDHPWLTVLGLMGFQAFNGGSLSVAVWLIASEVFPLRARGKAMSLAALTVWVADLLVSLTTLSLVEGLGPRWTFWLYGIVSVAAFVFVYFRVPETKGKTLEEIERSLDDGSFLPRRAAKVAR